MQLSQTLTLSQPEPDLASLIDPAEDFIRLTAGFLVEILWSFNRRHMAGVYINVLTH